MELSGRVVKKAFASGSKSERPGIFLISDRGEYLLRRRGANPFSDARLEALVGRKIICRGTLHDYTFIVESFTLLTQADPPVPGADQEQQKGPAGS